MPFPASSYTTTAENTAQSTTYMIDKRERHPTLDIPMYDAPLVQLFDSPQ